MFNVDTKMIQRLAPKMERVLVVDHNQHAARLLSELAKELGARKIATIARSDRALDLVAEFEPQLIFCEYAGPDLDGAEFTRRLRRSRLSSAQAPVIMVTAEATAASITAARNSGVHEFLRKPFTAGDLYRRIENVLTKPRLWIEAQMYVGPDRRRFNSEDYGGQKKRRNDGKPTIAAALAAASG